MMNEILPQKMTTAELVNLAKKQIAHEPNDLETLKQIKKLLVQGGSNDGRALSYTGILAVLTDDRQLWDSIAAKLGDSMNPSLAYSSYKSMDRASDIEYNKSEWFFLVHLSASQGYLMAKRDVFEDSLKWMGAFNLPIIVATRAILAVRVIRLTIKDKDNPILPSSARRKY